MKNMITNKPMKTVAPGLTPMTLAVLMLLLFYWPVFSQEEEQKEETDKKPARAAFESPQLFDEQSVVVPQKKTLEFNIQHRFGTVEMGIKDLYGIYAPANMRMGFTYTPINNLSVGFGFTKFKKFLDFNVKYAIIKQRKDWSIPVSISYFGNAAVDGREKKMFTEFVHRLSFFHELLIAARLSSKISIQLTPGFSHFNAADSLFSHDMVSLGISGRYKFSPQSSIVVNYNQQFLDHKAPNFNLRPGLTVGWEISTGSHAFQVFVTTFQGILPQENITYNQYDFTKGEVLIGFNITRLWNF